MGKKIDLTGKLFGINGENKVLEETELREGRSIVYRCFCGNCGNSKWKLSARRIKFDNPISCGCINNRSEANKIHGFTKCGERNRFYSIWGNIKARTSDRYKKSEMNNSNRSYISRDIKCCQDWECFEKFKKDMLPSYLEACAKHGEENVSIDRIDSNKDYSIDNCRWANPSMQSYNRDFTKHSKCKPVLAHRICDDHEVVLYNIKSFSRMIFNTPNNHITDVCNKKRNSEKGWEFIYINDEAYFYLKNEGFDFVESIYTYNLRIPHSVISDEESNISRNNRCSYLKSVLYYYINNKNKIAYGAKSKIYKELGFMSVNSMNSNLYKAKAKKVRKLTEEEIELHLQGHVIYFDYN